MGRHAGWVVPVALLAVLFACAPETETPQAGLDEPPPGTETPQPGLDGPPPVIVRYDDQSLELSAFTWCSHSACADGIPSELPDVGSPDRILVQFPLSGWSFTAFMEPAPDGCGRVHGVILERPCRSDQSEGDPPRSDECHGMQVPLENTGEGFVLTPVGAAGPYAVTLKGKGEGVLFVAFRWTTPTDGPTAKPAPSSSC